MFLKEETRIIGDVNNVEKYSSLAMLAEWEVQKVMICRLKIAKIS